MAEQRKNKLASLGTNLTKAPTPPAAHEEKTEAASFGANLNTAAPAVKMGKNKVKDLLDKKPKVSVRLLRQKDEKDENFVPVCINGYIYQVKKGEDVQVPAPVKKLLEEGGYI